MWQTVIIIYLCLLFGSQCKTICEMASDCNFHLYREFPGELEKIRVWFRDYKTPDGKPENKFGFDNQYKNREYTLHIVPRDT